MVPQMLDERIQWIGGTMLTSESEVLGETPVPLPHYCVQKPVNNHQSCSMA